MASSNIIPYRMTYPEFVAWATPKITTPEGRTEVRRALASLVGWANQSPDQKAAQQAMRLLSAENFTEATLTELTELSTNVLEAAEGQTEMATKETAPPTAPGLENVRAMNALASTAEGRIALQRARNGQDLTPQQQRLVDDYWGFEKAHNDAADAEKRSYDPPKPLNRYIGRDVMAFATNRNKVQRQQLAAEHRAKVLGDKDNPYWNASSTEHRAAVLGMKIATQMMQTGESDVQIGPDGTIEE